MANKVSEKQMDMAGAALKRANEAHPLSMARLASGLRCSYMAAERRLSAYLEREGLKWSHLKKAEFREGKAGPLSTGYWLP